MFRVNQYYLQVGTGLDRNIVNGGPVYSANGSGGEIGKIVDYLPDSGFAKILLFYDVNYVELVRSGIPMDHIVFKNVA
jgi:hypothetical protein